MVDQTHDNLVWQLYIVLLTFLLDEQDVDGYKWAACSSADVEHVSTDMA